MLPRAVAAATWGAGGNSGGASDWLDMAVPEGSAVTETTAPALAINRPAAFLRRSLSRRCTMVCCGGPNCPGQRAAGPGQRAARLAIGEAAKSDAEHFMLSPNCGVPLNLVRDLGQVLEHDAPLHKPGSKPLGWPGQQGSGLMRHRDPHDDPAATGRPERYRGPPTTLGDIREHGVRRL
jgi:hypothetical protein